eukprot:m51a1_g7184 hypothetical protein (215) ;mRNA; r:90352-91151
MAAQIDQIETAFFEDALAAARRVDELSMPGQTQAATPSEVIVIADGKSADSSEERRRKRMERNRKSAVASRQRRKDRVAELNEHIELAEKQSTDYAFLLVRLEAEQRVLMEQLEEEKKLVSGSPLLSCLLKYIMQMPTAMMARNLQTISGFAAACPCRDRGHCSKRAEADGGQHPPSNNVHVPSCCKCSECRKHLATICEKLECPPGMECPCCC